MASKSTTFGDWAERWMGLARYKGRDLLDEDKRIADIVALWHEPIPGHWQRGPDQRLLSLDRRYCRSNTGAAVRRGEHAVEYEILEPSPKETTTVCLGGQLIDGVNAVPLAKDERGGRAGNVEADMALLVRHDQEYQVLLVEVKTSSNNAWYAAVENLRQLKLFTQSPPAQRLFYERKNPGLPQALDTTAVVLAPIDFYTKDGAKGAAVAPADKLFARMRAETGYDARLATWDSHRRAVELYEPS